MTDPDFTEVTLTIRAKPDEVPAVIRFRRLLKTLDRAYSYKILRFDRIDGVQQAPPEEAAGSGI